MTKKIYLIFALSMTLLAVTDGVGQPNNKHFSKPNTFLHSSSGLELSSSISLSKTNVQGLNFSTDHFKLNLPVEDNNQRAGRFLRRAGNRLLVAYLVIPLLTYGTYYIIQISPISNTRTKSELLGITIGTGILLNFCFNIGGFVDLKRAGSALNQTPVRLY